MRASGILLHISSLPSPYGIGTMGAAAKDFVDFLVKAGQAYWQILPVCPTSYGDSPYQSFSTFAGNPYFIDLDLLAKAGLLQPEEYESIDWESTPGCVNYGALYQKRYAVLHKACARLLAAPPADYADFLAKNAFWLPDYALFMALKDAHNGVCWQQWEEPLRRREPETLAAARAKYAADIDFWQAVQYLFYTQWHDLKAYANAQGIEIIGDLPIYVAEDSVDVWSCPQEFQLDENLSPPRWPAARRMASPPPVSYGATRCLTGTLWLPTAMPGGCAASATCAEFMMCCALTISAALRGIMPSPMVIRPPKTAAGALARVMPSLLPSKKSWAAPALLLRTWAF